MKFFLVYGNFIVHQAPVVQRLDNAIQRISVNKTNHAIHWIVIYLVDNVIQLFNNRGQLFKLFTGKRETNVESWNYLHINYHSGFKVTKY